MRQNLTSPLRIARKKAGLSQSRLAKALGVTVASVSGWEAGGETPKTERLAAISRVLAPHFDLHKFVQHVETRARAR